MGPVSKFKNQGGKEVANKKEVGCRSPREEQEILIGGGRALWSYDQSHDQMSWAITWVKDIKSFFKLCSDSKILMKGLI